MRALIFLIVFLLAEVTAAADYGVSLRSYGRPIWGRWACERRLAPPALPTDKSQIIVERASLSLTSDRHVFWKGKPVPFIVNTTRKNYYQFPAAAWKILLRLADPPADEGGTIAEIIHEVWPEGEEGNKDYYATVPAYIYTLRRCFKAVDADFHSIETLEGKGGYRWVD